MYVLPYEHLQKLIAFAKAEDLGPGDITSNLLEAQSDYATFHLVSRQTCIFSGREVAEHVILAYGHDIQITWRINNVDGAAVAPNDIIAELTGPLSSILAAERVMLNFLQRLCGVATRTRKFVDAIAGTNAQIFDTRKTTPGWRELEKYAVKCGGGQNHRHGLFDAVLIKDNHLAGIQTSNLADSVFNMLNRLPNDRSGKKPFVQVEADSIEQVRELFKVVGIDSILLDNFSIDELRSAVAFRAQTGLDRVRFEASGGITLDTVRAVAETGVERISVGALTHSATAIDLALERA